MLYAFICAEYVQKVLANGRTVSCLQQVVPDLEEEQLEDKRLEAAQKEAEQARWRQAWA